MGIYSGEITYSRNEVWVWSRNIILLLWGVDVCNIFAINIVLMALLAGSFA